MKTFAIIVTAFASLLQTCRLSLTPAHDVVDAFLPSGLQFVPDSLPMHLLSWQIGTGTAAHVRCISFAPTIQVLLNLRLLTRLLHPSLPLSTGMTSLLGAPLVMLPLLERALVDGMQLESRAACSSDSDCLRAWADPNGFSAPGITNVGQCSSDSGRCKYSVSFADNDSRFSPLCLRASVAVAFVFSCLGALSPAHGLSMPACYVCRTERILCACTACP